MKKTVFLFILICSFMCRFSLCAQQFNWASGGTGGSEGWAASADPWGNSYETGFNNPAGGTQIFGPFTLFGYGDHATVVVKFDPYGKILWAWNTNIGVTRPLGIAADPWGNAYLLAWYSDTLLNVGPYNLRNPGATDGTVELFVAKFSASGTVLWAKNLCTTISEILPYWSEDGCIAVNGTQLYITGAFGVPVLNIGSYSFANADAPGLDLFLTKLDTSGNVVWAKSAGGAGDDISNFVAVTPAGNAYITGTFTSPTLNFGGFTLAHTNVSNVFLVKYDSTGNVLWATSPTGNAYDGSVGTDSAENAYLAGAYNTTELSLGPVHLSPDTLLDFFVAKYDASGNPLWAKKGSSNLNIGGYGVEPDPCGNVWVTGGMEKDSVVIIDGNVYTRAPESRDPMFLAGWAPNGNYISGNIIPTGGDDVSSLCIDGVGNLYIGGDYWGGPYTIGPDTLNDPNHAYENISVYQFQTSFVHDTNHVNTLVCIIDSPVVLRAPAGFPYYRWDDGTYSPNKTTSVTGTFVLYATGKCGSGVLKEVFTVAIGKFDTASTSQDTTACLNANSVLCAPAGYRGYAWSNGGSAQYDTVGVTGNYMVICEGTCTLPTLYDTFHVANNSVNLAFSLGDDTSICAPLKLRADVPGATYLWEDGTTGSTDLATQTGIYYVTASELNCYRTDSIAVAFVDMSQNLHDTDFCKNQPIELTLRANVPARGRALWSNGSTQDSITVILPGRYWVTVTDAACIGTDTMTLGSEDCNCNAVFPEAFTPNNDGLNDWYYPIIEKTCNLFDYTFCIYNRWGQMVFSTHEPTEQWNGKYFGVPQDIGAYMYYVAYSVAGSRKKYLFKGDFTLVR